jgi:hypothetical protein
VVVPKIKTFSLRYFISANALATQQFIHIFAKLHQIVKQFWKKNHVFQVDEIKNFAGSDLFHENQFYFFHFQQQQQRS